MPALVASALICSAQRQSHFIATHAQEWDAMGLPLSAVKLFVPLGTRLATTKKCEKVKCMGIRDNRCRENSLRVAVRAGLMFVGDKCANIKWIKFIVPIYYTHGEITSCSSAGFIRM